MNNYIFQFTPISPYFFGTENRRVDLSQADKDDTANYYLKSTAFPQQSTILGAIRYFFLRNICPDSVFKDNQIQNLTEAAKWIGKKSFDITESTFCFGKIARTSEVFLRKGGQNYLALPFDKWSNDFGELQSINDSYFLPKYDPKNYYEMVFTDGNERVAFDKVFQEHIQSGNKKSNKGDDDEDGFYKQQYYRLASEWSFAVELQTSEDLSNLKNKAMFMNMGGENRIFKIEIMNGSLDRNSIYANQKHAKYAKLILTSDTYLKKTPSKSDYLFSRIETKPFRYLSSEIEKTTLYNNRSKDKQSNSMISSNLYELIERGCLFYFKDVASAENFASNYLNNSYLMQAGMNQFVILTSKS